MAEGELWPLVTVVWNLFSGKPVAPQWCESKRTSGRSQCEARNVALLFALHSALH